MKMKKLICAALFAATLAIPSFAKDKESPDITVFRPAVNPRDKKDVMVRAAAAYKEATGGKVTFVISDWNNWQAKILTYMAAGEPIDVVFARDADFPRFYAKGYVQPIDGYVNLNVPYLNKTGMEMAFKYNNKYYLASHVTSAHYWIIAYNKSLMDEEGIPESEQPEALYKAGKWNWDNLRKLSIKLTKDTTGSGKIDRWGFANWYTQGFVYMNGTNFTTTDKKGNVSLNFEDQRLVEALTYLETAKKEGWYMQDNNIARDGLQKRKVAMMMEREYYPVSVLKDTKDELGYVPLPAGPGNKSPKNVFETDGYGIGNGSKSPTYAGKFIDICLKTWYDDDMEQRKGWPKEILKLTKEVEKNQIYPGPAASAIDTLMSKFLGEIVWTGNSASTAITGYTAAAQTLIDEANKPMEKPVRLPFKNVKIDFEDGDISMFKVGGDKLTSVKLSVVEGDNAIKGKSLLVSCDSAVDGEWLSAIVSDTAKLGLVGWRDYKVSFDVKALKSPASGDTVATFQVYKDDIDNWGWVAQKIDAAGTVYAVKGNVVNMSLNGTYPVRFGGRFINDFVIDNIVITANK